MKELELLATIQRHESFTKASPGGIGDDCALLESRPDFQIIVSTDLLQEHVHFSRAWSTPAQIGQKLVSVNLSDIAAMGGSACCALLWKLDISRRLAKISSNLV